jgi:glycosyltransferase involved in cell wall biosynthesis
VNSRPPAADGKPSISVVIPTRDRPEAVRRAVDSVLGQDYSGPIECVVVFDRTSPVALPDPAAPGRTVESMGNTGVPGPAGARNCGVRMANGELVAFCDDDDRWLPGKLREQVAALQAHPDVGAVSSGVRIRYRGRSVVRIPSLDRLHLKDLTRSRFTEIHTSTLVVRRDDYLGPIGPFDETMPEGYGEDYEWLLRATRWKPLLVVRRPLVTIDWHEASWFDRRWETIIAGIHRLLERHPEIREDSLGLARLYGRLAFAHAAAGRPRRARSWAGRALRLNWRELRAYVALAVASGVVRARTVVALAHRVGRGV